MVVKRLVVSVVALAAVLGTLATAQADTTFRYKFKEGEKLTYRVETKGTMKMNVVGQELSTEMSESYDQALEIKSVDKNSHKFTLQFANYKFAMDMPGIGKIEYDQKEKKKPEGPIGESLAPILDAYATSEFTGTITNQGEIKEIKIPEKLKKAIEENAMPGMAGFDAMFSDEALKTKLSQLFPTFPEEAVAQGKGWKNKQEMNMGGMKAKVELAYAYEGKVKHGDREVEKFTVKPKYAFEADPNAPFKFDLKKQDSKATVLFDSAAGRIVEVTSTDKLEMGAEAGGQTIAATVDQTMTSKLVK